MILSLRFSNFYSFADETLIDFRVGQKPTPSGYDIKLEHYRLNKVVAVVGANGSGKTQFIKPLEFLSWFVCQSFLEGKPEADLPYQPHRLTPDEDSFFELDFLLEGKEYRYQLTLNKRRVVREGLFVKTSSKFSYLFKWEKTAEGFSFSQKGFPFPEAKAKSLRDNTSILGTAHNYDIKEAAPFINWFFRTNGNVSQAGREPFHLNILFKAAKVCAMEPEIKGQMTELMLEIDLGLSDILIRKMERITNTGETETIYMPFGVHTSSTGQSFELPFTEESSGTQSAFVLLLDLLAVLILGGIAVIDEIDNDLHPHLIPKILDWFRFEHSNPKQAQLIFTCHTPEVLNLLQKHQVYLCEKHDQCSEAWRLDEVTGLRADDNLYAKYMAGALGAVPEV